MSTKRGEPPATIWAYAYEIVPPQTEERLRTIKTLLDREHSNARSESRTWTSNILLERHVTAILVVSDSAGQDREINQKLEAELKDLKVGFSITAPLAVADDATPRPAEAALTQSMNGKENV